MQEVKAPDHVLWCSDPGIKIFLAGSIEMGTAELWHDKVVKALTNIQGVIYNPRRDDWDSSWEQKKTNPQFNEQVTWELNQIKKSDIVFFYFDPNTKSPITLLELGLVLSTKKMVIVVCPEGFYRKGNVDITCEMFRAPVYGSFDEGLKQLKNILKLNCAMAIN